jgi:hypothetical protein
MSLMGGADVFRQALAGGFVDEIELHIVPVLFGAETRLFDTLPNQRSARVGSICRPLLQAQEIRPTNVRKRLGCDERRVVRETSHVSRHQLLPLIVIRFAFDRALSVFGSVIVRTPLLKAAETLSSATSPSGIRRSKLP